MKSIARNLFRIFAVLALLSVLACRGTKPAADDPFNLPQGGAGTGLLDDTDWVTPFPLEGDSREGGIFTSGTPVAVSISPVYFAFDSYRVAPGEIYKIQQAADHLRTNTGHVVIVEGHTDERGSREYNLALGERRALAVREALVGFGVGAERIQTLSYGEEQPATPGHDERAWSQNRRAEFRVLR